MKQHSIFSVVIVTIKTFSDEGKLREFVASTLAQKEILNEAL